MIEGKLEESKGVATRCVPRAAVAERFSARGLLADDNTRLATATFGRNWGLDATGNWSAFKQFDAQGSTFSALVQQRTSNAANEITASARRSATFGKRRPTIATGI